MKLAIEEIENKIKEYKDLLKKNKPLDYGEGVVEGLEEALTIVKKFNISSVGVTLPSKKEKLCRMNQNFVCNCIDDSRCPNF